MAILRLKDFALVRVKLGEASHKKLSYSPYIKVSDLVSLNLKLMLPYPWKVLDLTSPM